jgi:hypothetical protein
MTSMTTVKVIVTGYKGASYPLQPMSDLVLMTTPCHWQPTSGNPQQAHLDFSNMTGQFLTHEVGDWQGNNRVSSVRYIWADVFKDAKIPEPGWANVQSVKAQPGILWCSSCIISEQ